MNRKQILCLGLICFCLAPFLLQCGEKVCSNCLYTELNLVSPGLASPPSEVLNDTNYKEELHVYYKAKGFKFFIDKTQKDSKGNLLYTEEITANGIRYQYKTENQDTNVYISFPPNFIDKEVAATNSNVVTVNGFLMSYQLLKSEQKDLYADGAGLSLFFRSQPVANTATPTMQIYNTASKKIVEANKKELRFDVYILWKSTQKPCIGVFTSTSGTIFFGTSSESFNFAMTGNCEIPTF